MSLKEQRLTIGLDCRYKAFLEELVNDGTFRNLVDAIRFCITLSRFLLTKPWNPYLTGRHSSLTEISKHIPDALFRQHGGWSRRSKVPAVYTHYFNNEAAKALLQYHGIEEQEESSQKILQPKPCPNCSEVNKPDANFCSKCRMVLTYQAYTESTADIQELKEMLIETNDRVIQLQEELEHSRRQSNKIS
jgi:hypothetical protein